MGDVYGDVARDVFNATHVREYTATVNMLESLRLGRVDAVMLGSDFIGQTKTNTAYQEYQYILVPEHVFATRAAPVFHTTELRDLYNDWLEIVKNDGTWDEMKARWIDGALPDEKDIPVFNFTGENGTLTVCDTGSYPPMSYLDSNGNPVGFDIEMISRFAVYAGLDLNVIISSYDAIVPYVASGRADMSACMFAITPERTQGVYFSNPAHLLQVIIISYDGATGSTTQSTGGLFEWLRTGIQRNLIDSNRWKLIVNGLGVTMIISFGAQIIGTAMGGFICYLLTRKNPIIRKAAEFYCGMVNGMPIIVLLLFMYYIVFGRSNISDVFVAILSFSLIKGASVAKTLKGAIGTVDPVEIEAARSTGLSASGAFLWVTLPQAIRFALPVYNKSFVDLVKLTSVVGYIAVQDLTRAGDIIRSYTFDSYFPILFVAAIYMSVTAVYVWLLNLLVTKINRGVK